MTSLRSMTEYYYAVEFLKIISLSFSVTDEEHREWIRGLLHWRRENGFTEWP